MNIIKSILLAFTLLIISSCTFKTSVTAPNLEIEKKPTNIILMIGDGMGLSQMTAGYLENDRSLNLERANIIGLSNTTASDKIITDSAAGATAFSIGEKTYNGAIGVDENKVPKETILETLANQGLSTGLIATCNITHATPASFYAHQPYRSMYYEIAADMVDADVDLFIGGGKIHFEDRTNEKNGTIDNRNITRELTDKGVSFVNSLEELSTTNGRVGYFYSDDHPESILNGRGPILPNSIEPAIAHLQKESDEGFFLVVEGSQIDWGGHANETDYIITEMIDFDKAVGKALDFAERDGNTLVIITADHETGGFALKSKGDDYTEFEGSFTSGGHTAVMVPVYAFGPKAELFQGIYNNNEIYNKMRIALGR